MEPVKISVRKRSEKYYQSLEGVSNFCDRAFVSKRWRAGLETQSRYARIFPTQQYWPLNMIYRPFSMIYELTVIAIALILIFMLSNLPVLLLITMAHCCHGGGRCTGRSCGRLWGIVRAFKSLIRLKRAMMDIIRMIRRVWHYDNSLLWY